MASYKYRVIVTEPGSSSVELDRDKFEPFTASTATAYAHRSNRRPAGTTIRVRRIRAVPETIDPRDAAARQRAQNPRRVPAPRAEWVLYREYLVHEDGIVRRVGR